MEMQDHFKRLLSENLSKAWQRYVAVVGLAIGWYPVYKVVEVLTTESKLSLLQKLLITAAVYLLTAIGFGVYFMYASLADAYRKLGPDTPTHKHLADLAAQLVGVQKRIHAIVAEVLPDGSSNSVFDVKLVALARNIAQIEYRSSTPSVPDSVDGSIEVTAEPRHESGVQISAEVLRSDKRNCFWSVNFVPALSPGTVVSYRYRQKALPKSFAMTQAEMKQQGAAYEYYATCVTYPTEKLKLRLIFAKETFPQRIHYDVWLGQGGVRHMAEYVRVEAENHFETGTDEDGRLWGELKVPHPIQGLRYVIIWVPGK